MHLLQHEGFEFKIILGLANYEIIFDQCIRLIFTIQKIFSFTSKIITIERMS